MLSWQLRAGLETWGAEGATPRQSRRYATPVDGLLRAGFQCGCWAVRSGLLYGLVQDQGTGSCLGRHSLAVHIRLIHLLALQRLSPK